MGVRILASETTTKVEPTLWVDSGCVFSAEKGCIASDGQDVYARAAQFALAAGDLVGKTVAWIGGGLCVGPRLFAVAGCRQTVYEIEPALAEFCPRGVTFVPGDYQDTFNGSYDIIVYDLGGPTPPVLLDYLSPGGKLLGDPNEQDLQAGPGQPKEGQAEAPIPA